MVQRENWRDQNPIEPDHQDAGFVHPDYPFASFEIFLRISTIAFSTLFFSPTVGPGRVWRKTMSTVVPGVMRVRCLFNR